MVTETKLYDVLEISSKASQDEIKKAYRKAALKWHPDKNKDKSGAEDKFKEVSQAYEILSDPEKRKVYDQFGLDYLQRGGPPPPPPGSGAGSPPFDFGNFAGSGFPTSGGNPRSGGRSFHFSTGGSGGFESSDPYDTFSTFVRNEGPSAPGHPDDDLYNLFSRINGGGFGGSRDFGDTSMRRPRSPEVTTVERDLPVSLEDLFRGAHKRMKIKRKTYDEATGKRKVEDKILEIDIRPGYKAGTKIKFKGVGDQEEGGQQDMHFIVKEKPHQTLRRDGDDIRTTIMLTLKEALTGWSKTVTTIDGKQVQVSGPCPTQPGYEQSFPGLGMPTKKNSGRGNFMVDVKVEFPKFLTPSQKMKLNEIL